jgi:hypothetical protein
MNNNSTTAANSSTSAKARQKPHLRASESQFKLLNQMAVIKYGSLNFVLMGTPVESTIRECLDVILSIKRRVGPQETQRPCRRPPMRARLHRQNVLGEWSVYSCKRS